MWKLLAATALCLAATAASSETLYYRYDALGRLANSFSDRSSLRTDYSFDAADNRNQVVTINVVIILQTGQTMQSPDGRFTLAMQGDGNLVLYGPSGSLWATSTVGTGATSAVMQGDGNLVLYTAAGQSVWGSGTWGNPGSKLQLQNDGNLVIYNFASASIWASNTGGH